MRWDSIGTPCRAGSCSHQDKPAKEYGYSCCDLSRYMGSSLAMIDRHYGHLGRDGREHAIKLLDTHRVVEPRGVHAVDAAWTPTTPHNVNGDNGKV
jgi:hypothetical protein